MMDDLKITTRAEYAISFLGLGAEGVIFAPSELVPASTFNISTDCWAGGGMYNVYPQRQKKYWYYQMIHRYNW